MRDQVVVVNTGVADAVARRYAGRGEPVDDLRQVAYVGLTAAAQRYVPTPHGDFLSFAVPTMTGEIRRHFRDRGWLVRPPRRIQDLRSRIVRDGLDQPRPDGSRPTTAEVAETLDAPAVDVAAAMEAGGCYAGASLDAIRDEGGSAGGGWEPSSCDDVDAIDARAVLGEGLHRLRAADRTVVVEWLFHDRSQHRIGAERGMTQSQVSRLIARSLRHLRVAVGETS